ncbi:hypothetical protein DFH08DRAFT_812010 [Mycena albidolilacea]|uniref:Uncharacterized protein n=1 Tax=Mycena albidolilacea TaxID=1033008 RepID=A0AAD6ZVL1_9AGAR|nr:hypothetical protein DFH08DRAFT_812010 [Mycena albidolilacea]
MARALACRADTRPAGASNTSYSPNFEIPTPFLEYDGGVGGVECRVQSQAFWTCLAAQPMAFHKPVKDHREPRHPHHGVKSVYNPENVVEVLEVSNVGSNQLQASCTQRKETSTPLSRKCSRGSDETGRQAHGSGKQHLNMRDSRGVGGEKVAEVLEVDHFYIAGDADTESKQFKLEDI